MILRFLNSYSYSSNLEVTGVDHVGGGAANGRAIDFVDFHVRYTGNREGNLRIYHFSTDLISLDGVVFELPKMYGMLTNYIDTVQALDGLDQEKNC